MSVRWHVKRKVCEGAVVTTRHLPQRVALLCRECIFRPVPLSDHVNINFPGSKTRYPLTSISARPTNLRSRPAGRSRKDHF
jgi:hypothetical protein